MDHALHSPLQDTKQPQQHREWAASKYPHSPSLPLPFPSCDCTYDASWFPTASKNCQFCSSLSRQTLRSTGLLTRGMPSIIQSCLLLVCAQHVRQCIQTHLHTRAHSYFMHTAKSPHAIAPFYPYLCLIWVYTCQVPLNVHMPHSTHTCTYQLSHVQALCTSCSKKHRVPSAFFC